MLQTVASSTQNPDWHVLGGYDFLRTVSAGRSAMANRQRNSSGRGSAQPLNFRNHSGQIDASDSLAQTPAGLGNQQTTYATSQYGQASLHSGRTDNWPPQATTLHTTRVDYTDGDARQPAHTWQSCSVAEQPGSQYFHPGVPRRSVRLPPGHTPSIQISTTLDTLDSQIASIPQAALPFPQEYLAVNGYSMLYDQQIPPMADVASSVSPTSHHSGPSRAVTPLPESTARKRSYSELSQDAHSSLHVTVSPDGYDVRDEQPAVRKSRTIKRSDAPMNGNHKYICNISADCAGLVFDRKCEWGKHMDKHDRPYRCPHPSCAKLQGFTYSGGLLRHEREVHNKHGGPRAFLMCPYSTCKRHTEKGFTRKENLQEHIRRVHSEGDADTHRDVAPTLDQLDQLDQPPSALSTGASADELYVAAALNGNKRRRSIVQEESLGGEVQELREQVRRLRTENEAKSAVIHRLEEDARTQSARLMVLERAVQQHQSVQ